MANPEDLVYRLMTKKGKFVTVDGDKQTLYADDKQKKNGQRVHIAETVIDKAKCMAFLFWHENTHYALKVKDQELQLEKKCKQQFPPKVKPTELQLEKQDSKESPGSPKSYYFKKYNFGDGDHHGLQSVVEPNLYICERADKSLFLSSLKNNPVHVIKYTVKASTTTISGESCTA